MRGVALRSHHIFPLLSFHSLVPFCLPSSLNHPPALFKKKKKTLPRQMCRNFCEAWVFFPPSHQFQWNSKPRFCSESSALTCCNNTGQAARGKGDSEVTRPSQKVQWSVLQSKAGRLSRPPTSSLLRNGVCQSNKAVP